MEGLQIRGRRLDQASVVSAFYAFDHELRSNYLDRGDERQIDLVIS